MASWNNAQNTEINNNTKEKMIGLEHMSYDYG